MLKILVTLKTVQNYRVIKNDCRGFNNLSYIIHLRFFIYFLYNRTKLQVFVTYLTVALFVHPGLFKMIVGVLIICHTQYTCDFICIFYVIEQHSKFLLYTVQALYMCNLCDSTNINTII